MQAHGLKPRARVVHTGNMGDCPTLMLNAPVPSVRKILRRAGMTLADIDLIEISELLPLYRRSSSAILMSTATR